MKKTSDKIGLNDFKTINGGTAIDDRKDVKNMDCGKLREEVIENVPLEQPENLEICKKNADVGGKRMIFR